MMHMNLFISHRIFDFVINSKFLINVVLEKLINWTWKIANFIEDIFINVKIFYSKKLALLNYSIAK